MPTNLNLMQIIVFSSPNCHACDLLKVYLKAQKRAFVELDVNDSKNQSYISEYQILSVPTMVVRNENAIQVVKTGFSPKWLEQDFEQLCESA